MAHFVIIGQKARATPDFLLEDLPSTSGRLDVLCRSIRAALLTSHGVRDGSIIYLVLESGPRTIKIVGGLTKFLRPDERSMAVLLKKTLAVDPEGPAFHQIRFGLSIAGAGLEAVLADLPPASNRWFLDRSGADVRTTNVGATDTFFIGDHMGFSEQSRAMLEAYRPISLGPVDLHAEDAVAVVWNEIDRATVGV